MTTTKQSGRNSGGEWEEAKAKDVALARRLGLNQNPETLEEMLSNGIKMAGFYVNDPYVDYRPVGGGEVLDMNLIKKYIKRVEESDGFDVDVYPGPCAAATFIPVANFKTNPEVYKDLFEMATLALDEFTEDNQDSSKAERYVLVEIEKATFLTCAGDIYHITCSAREAETDNIKTFQAKVFYGIEEDNRYVMLVRMKF